MKTFTRLFVLPALLCAFFGLQTANAQLVITPDPSVSANNTFTISNPNATFEHGISLKNNGSTSMTVKVFRNIVTLVDDRTQATFFCWGETCYTPDIEESSVVTIPAGQTLTDHLKTSVEPNGLAGQLQVGYRVQVTQNGQTTNQNISFFYVVQPASISPTFVATSGPKLSVPSPNPAIGTTRIDYSLMGASSAVLTISDLLGKEVQDITLSPAETSLNLNVSNMKPGLYFCTLHVGGKAVATQRLIVTK